MKVDVSYSSNMSNISQDIKHLEALGYQGIKIAETDHDPFLPLTLAAEHSQNIQLISSVAVAFARNPMSMAHLAHDLNAFSKGRFIPPRHSGKTTYWKTLCYALA